MRFVTIRHLSLSLIATLQIFGVLQAQPQGSSLPPEDDPYALGKYLRPSSQQGPFVSAHRGGLRDDIPENSLLALKATVAQGVRIIEVDVRKTRDNVLVLLHDSDLSRTTTCKGQVSLYRFADLSSCYLRSWDNTITKETIPSLETAIDWTKGKAILTLDIKGDLYEEVVTLVQTIKARGTVTIITYGTKQALDVHKLGADLVISGSLSSESELISLPPTLRAAMPTVWVGVGFPDQDLVASLQGYDISPIAGTFNTADRGRDYSFEDFLAVGVEVLASNVPERAKVSAKNW
ncbi:glycerophosphodiester phosphodiesterase family protein [Pseudobacteriovorax antillogorgiicola]|uniref:Glycerophosphoryl diester phosphodiesterase n=1 Tax=Pseudobacteriovorax antillogorgiicola TaxID=1513793 RepID=A0A1Y6C381_9BACT|nr:glycerophosphodiester phosphodiesterase family protein [Pseudobacteriovorax antillogorgiicola]TCS49829.1 glycerophosphoryl diester phosphodiesterase [Pseudobacteriovorax antillogorgiicola]SMF43363.1 glycerophosphoryl diester phosphodiesterase [Pseudobacteriovorax antillogorgiicola]